MTVPLFVVLVSLPVYSGCCAFCIFLLLIFGAILSSFFLFVICVVVWFGLVSHPFGCSHASSDVAKWVMEFFVNSYPEFKVASIQQASGRVTRVTFDRDSVAAKETIEGLGEVTIHGVY